MFFFEQLPDPLFTRTYFSAYRTAVQAEDKAAMIAGSCAIVSNLPKANVAGLRVLLKLFMKVIDSSISHLIDLPPLARAGEWFCSRARFQILPRGSRYLGEQGGVLERGI